MSTSPRLKLAAALALFAVAAGMTFRHFSQDDGISEQAFFYDLSQQKLFAGPRTAVPPIRGLDDAAEDAVRAVVISTTGKPEDKSSWQIAYLEKYSPELKRQMEAAQSSGGSPPMGRGAAQLHRLVKRPADAAWHPMNSPEGEIIVSDWARPGPNGLTPVVCAP